MPAMRTFFGWQDSVGRAHHAGTLESTSDERFFS